VTVPKLRHFVTDFGAENLRIYDRFFRWAVHRRYRWAVSRGVISRHRFERRHAGAHGVLL